MIKENRTVTLLYSGVFENMICSVEAAVVLNFQLASTRPRSWRIVKFGIL